MCHRQQRHHYKFQTSEKMCLFAASYPTEGETMVWDNGVRQWETSSPLTISCMLFCFHLVFSFSLSRVCRSCASKAPEHKNKNGMWHSNHSAVIWRTKQPCEMTLMCAPLWLQGREEQMLNCKTSIFRLPPGIWKCLDFFFYALI